MLQILGKTLVEVGMVKPWGSVALSRLLKPVSVTRVACLTQQSPLPKMPVPPLKQSCEMYLSVLETFLKPEEMNHTKKLVEEFMKPGGVGEKLQRGLERRARNTENCLTDDYLKHGYFMKRLPLTICSNFGILCTRQDIKDKQGQIRCAAEFTASLLDIKAMIDNETLPVEYMRGKPLCMKQYEQVFSSCRLPRLKTDSMIFLAKSPDPPKHITVVHNGHFYALNVYNSDGNQLTVEQLCVQLEKICNSSQETSLEPLGILTTQQRSTWSKTYISLMQDETNKESVSAIESSIFTLCLDGPMPPVSDEMMYRRSGLLQMLHGGGSQWYSGNRWFDKGLQVIIGEDGTRGLNCGHTVADGSVFMTICDYAVAKINEEKLHMMQAPTDPLPMPQKLHFNITSKIKQDIEEAKQHMDTMAQITDMTVTVFDHFGKNAIKAHKMSPDAFIQMAIQLAYYRVYRKFCSTLEPVSLRMFRLGRVTMMSSNSSASVSFVKAFDDPKKQNVEKVDLLEKAIEVHTKCTEMVMNGQVTGEHFLGLLSQASLENMPVPHIFIDICIIRAYDFHDLSTGQMTSKTGCLMCACIEQFGTYDVSYSIMDNRIDCRVSSLEASSTSKEKNPKLLSRALEAALLDMMSLLEETRSQSVN